MADGEHAAVHANEPAEGDPSVDLIVARPERAQLQSRDHAVLPSGERRHRLPQTASREFAVRGAVKTRFGGHAARVATRGARVARTVWRERGGGVPGVRGLRVGARAEADREGPELVDER